MVRLRSVRHTQESLHGKKADGKKTELIRLEGDVRFENVVFGYVREKTILNGISLYAKPGQKIAFVGSTGAGQNNDYQSD